MRVKQALDGASYVGGDGRVVRALYMRFLDEVQEAFKAAAEAVGHSTECSTYYGDTNASGEREGLGKANYADGETYSGNWLEGKKHGRGQVLYANGDTYVGEFESDLRHGPGIFLDAKGWASLSICSEGDAVGEGVRFAPNRKSAFKMRNGETARKPEEVDLEEAHAIAALLGLIVPPKHTP